MHTGLRAIPSATALGGHSHSTHTYRTTSHETPTTEVARGVGSPRAQTVLPAGMVLWAWDADPEFDEPAGEKWLALLPKKWNTQQLYGWRYDPREFGSAPVADERRRGAMRDA